MRPPDPSRLNRVTAARIESPASSTHTLHDEPAATYMKLSGPITSVRVPWPPLGRPDTKVSGVVVPGSSRFTSVCSAKYVVSPRNAMPKGALRPPSTVCADASATPSPLASTESDDPARPATGAGGAGGAGEAAGGACCPPPAWRRRARPKRVPEVDSSVGVMLRVHTLQCTLARRHLLAAPHGCLRGALDLGCYRRFDLGELLPRDPIRLQVFLVHPDRIPLAPMLEQRSGEGVARLALVVGRVPAHPERLGNEQRRSVALAAALGGDPGRGIRVEHVVTVERRTHDTIARRPVLEVAGEVVLVQSGAEGDLIVLDDEDRRELLNRGEVRALVCRPGLGGAIAYPGEGNARLPPDLERERDSGGHRDHIAH